MSSGATSHVRPHALITGGARRVGRAIALALAKAGCDVTITFAASEADANATRADLEASGVNARAVHLDLASAASIEHFCSDFLASSRPLDVLIHNASRFESTPIASLRADAIALDYHVNALAPLLLSARLAPLLSRSTLTGGGSIVALADIHALGRPRKDFSSYAMSKAALIEMVRSLARDLAPTVRVSAIAPGVVAWPESGPDQPYRGPETDPKMQAAYLSRVPLQRSGTLDEAAEAVRWLALDATYITGEIIRLDGGRWLA